MANTTLVIGGTTITFQDNANSFIDDNNAKKEAILSPMPLYSMDSSDTDVFDFGGTIKTVTLSGRYYNSAGVTGLKTWVDSVEALIQGHQDSEAGYPATFTDDLRGTLKVKIMDFDSTFVAGEPTLITWTIKLVESGVNS